MRVVRRVVIFAGLLALLWGAAQFVLPVKVTVGSVLPGPLDAVLPDSVSNQRLDCGTVAAPAEFDSITDLLRLDCDRALASARRRGLLWMGVGAGGALFAVAILREPKVRHAARPRSRRNDVTNASLSPSSHAPVSSPPTGPTSSRAVLPPPPLGAPAGVPSSALPADREKSHPRSHRRAAPFLTGFVMVSVGIIVALFIAGRNDSSNSSSALHQSSGEIVEPVNQSELNCMSAAIAGSDVLHEQAQAASRLDRDQAILNLDGDTSYLDYAQALERLDLTDCPRAFRAAFATWIETWRLYGRDLQDGGAEIADYITMIQIADDGVGGAASEAGLDVPSRTWGVTSRD